jgi:hypothetical protein
MRIWPAIRAIFVPGRSNILAGLAGLFIGSAAGFSLILRAHRTSPVTIYSAYELDGVVHPGGHLDLLFDVDRTRDCPSQTSRWLWTWVRHDNEFIRQYFPLTSSNASITDAGTTEKFILSMPIPVDIWPGEWFYTAKTIERCPIIPGLENSKILQAPDIPVRVVDDPELNR